MNGREHGALKGRDPPLVARAAGHAVVTFSSETASDAHLPSVVDQPPQTRVTAET
ncbi:MAG: hypothetical protein FLDDKLPJ_02562 [Phycisphaerae bacterium]|nr:hypothetical protein [Phycisphaerae bacterium]